MKYALPLLTLSLFVQAQENLQKQLDLYKKHENLVIKSIQNPNSKKFDNSFKIFMGEKQEDPSTIYPFISPLLKTSDQLIEKLKIAFQTQENEKKFNLEEKRNKALLNFQKIIEAFSHETFIQEKYCTFGMHIWKLWDGIRYLGAAFGLWVLGTIAYTGGMENVNTLPTQEFIYNCLGIPHTIPVALQSGEKTGLILYGLCAAATCYGGKNIYEALLYKTNLKHNKKELEKIKSLLKQHKSN
jgi:hypothetical protein